jgi:hypothetical protein
MLRPIRHLERTAQMPLISSRRHADPPGEQCAKGSEAAEPYVETYVGDRAATGKQPLRDDEPFPRPELMRCLAEEGLESSDEVE